MGKFLGCLGVIALIVVAILYWVEESRPPLAILWRAPLVGSNPVLQVKNGGKETLFDVWVAYTNESGRDVKWLIAGELAPNESVEIGGFRSPYVFSLGQKVTIGVRGVRMPIQSKVLY